MFPDVIKKMAQQLPLDKSSFLEKTHFLESAIDVLKLNKALPMEWQQKLRDFQGQLLSLV